MIDPARQLLESGQEYARLSADFWRLLIAPAQASAAAASAGESSWRQAFAGHYRRFLTPEWPAHTIPAVAVPALLSAVARCQRAYQALDAQAAAIAGDAAGRFAAELARGDAAASPIATLRELGELWIDCGERAWAAAVHQDAFADAQAEWLASLADLQLAQRRLPAAVQGQAP